MAVLPEVLASVERQIADVQVRMTNLKVEIDAKEEELKQTTLANMPKGVIDTIRTCYDHLLKRDDRLSQQLVTLQLRLVAPQAMKSSSQHSSEVPVSDSEENKLWTHYVRDKQVPCEAVEPELADWLEEVPDVLIAARFLHFLEYEGRACSVEKLVLDFQWMPNKVLEVPWQPMLLPVLRAAAGGQPDLMVVPEERSAGDSAREDFCTKIKLPTGGWAGVGPGGMKAHLAHSTTKDPTGIHSGQNLDNHAKVFQVCWGKLLGYGREFVCICTVSLEALWIVRLCFAKDVPQCATLDKDCKVLEQVDVTPPFLVHNTGLAHPGFIVPSLRKVLEEIQYISDPTLTDLVTATWGGVPPGFRLAAREAATQAKMWGLPSVSLMLQPEGGGAAIATSSCCIIAAGRHSLVLQLAGRKGYVIKIATSDKIRREVDIHSHADKAETNHIRKLYRDSSGAPLIGTVQGAGGGLDFLALDGYFRSTLQPALDSTKQQAAKLAQQAWSGLKALHDQKVVHRDLKPENMLIDSNGDLRITDLDMACLTSDDKWRRSERVGNKAYGSFKRMQIYELRDDDLSLGLVLAEVLGIWTPEMEDGKEKALQELCNRVEVPEDMRIALRKHLAQ